MDGPTPGLEGENINIKHVRREIGDIPMLSKLRGSGRRSQDLGFVGTNRDLREIERPGTRRAGQEKMNEWKSSQTVVTYGQYRH